MKKNVVLSVASAMLVMVSCSKQQELPAGNHGTKLKSTVATVTLPGIISEDRTLTSDTLYLLDGKTFVTNGAELTINAGTQIEGVYKSVPDSASALIITRGAKIYALGVASSPVVFTAHLDANNTSSEPGDWGGVVLLGQAPVNSYDGTTYPAIEGINPPTVSAGIDYRYGGSDEGDNSGTLQYVRVEYAGAIIATDNELNALTFGGVGSGTTLEHVEAFQGADDGFEFFGGTVNGKYLLSVSNNDDMFDFDNGYRGNLQFLVAIIDPSVLYASNNTNGIESDNNATGSTATPVTRPVISNLTIVGPPSSQVSTANAVLSANRWRRNTRFVVRNSVFYNFPVGIKLESTGTINSVSTYVGGSSIDSSYFTNNVVSAGTTTYVGWLTTPVGQDVASVSALGLNSPVNYNDFFTNGLLPTETSPAYTGANFAGLTPLNGDFEFQTVTYKGGAVDADGNYWLAESWVKH